MKDKSKKTKNLLVSRRVKKSNAAVLKKIRPGSRAAVPRPDEYYRPLFENAQVGIFLSRIDGSAMIDVNKKLCDIFGFTREEMLSSPGTILWADRAKRAEMIERLRADGYVSDYEVPIVTKSGEVRICLGSIRINEKAGVIEGTALDITGLRRTEEKLQKQKEELEATNEELMAAEEELRVQLNELAAKQQDLSESERKFRDTVKNLDEGYYSVTMDGLLLDHNRAFNLILGIDIERDMKGAKLPDFWQNPDERKEYLKELMAHGFIRNYLINAKKINGEKIVVMASVHLVKNEHGRIVRIDGTFTDFTEHKRAEEALKISKDRLLFATEGANLGIWNWDTVTGELIWSDKCKELFGIPLDETMSYPRFSEALHPDDRERTDRAVKDALDNHTDYDIEYRSLWPDGSVHWLAAKGRGYYDATGKAVRLEGIVLDVTERKRAEEEIKLLNQTLEQRVRDRTAELEAANKELEAFSYSVSHDLRAPLRTIDGFSQAVLEDYGDRLDGPGKDYLNRLRAASQNMGRLIDDILKLSQITRSEMQEMPVDLSAIARAIADELKAAQPEREAAFIIAEGVCVNGDPALLRIVMENLINNAWKFTGRHPGATIEFGAADIAGERTLYVRDNGAGFDMKYVDKLFGPFQRLHSVSDFEGSGIGLTLIKRIIIRHRGRIWAEGAVEKGATVYFTLGQ